MVTVPGEEAMMEAGVLNTCIPKDVIFTSEAQAIFWLPLLPMLARLTEHMYATTCCSSTPFALGDVLVYQGPRGCWHPWARGQEIQCLCSILTQAINYCCLKQTGSLCLVLQGQKPPKIHAVC